MIIFLYGPDGYRLKENVDIIVGAYRKKHQSGVSFYRFDFLSDKNYDDLTNAVKSVSFFDETKLILVKNIFSNKAYAQDAAALIRNLKLNTDKNIVLLFVENKNGKDVQKMNEDLFEILKGKNNIVREVEPLNGIKLANWVKGKFKENSHNVSLIIASLLIDIIGNESWALANEIEKLSNYLTGKTYCDKSYPLTQEDINLLVGHKQTNSIFDLVDAVGNQNKTKAFEMMYRLINGGHDGHYLLSMLVYHFESLLSVSDTIEKEGPLSFGLIAKKCGLHPFVAQKAVSQVKKFQKANLIAKFNQLASLDISSKSGLTNLEDSLYNLVVS